MNNLPQLPQGFNKVLLVLVAIYAAFYGTLGFLGLFLGVASIYKSGSFPLFISTMNSVSHTPFGFVIFIIGIFQYFLLVLAFPSLFKKKIFGWNLLFASQLASLIKIILAINPTNLPILGLIISLIYIYLIAQLRSYYT